MLALAVAIQFVASWFYDQDVSNDVWAFLNWFMAIGVIAAVAFSYERWRGTDASDAGVSLVALGGRRHVVHSGQRRGR